MEPPGRCGDWLAPPPSPPRAHAPGRHDERGAETSTWPPAGTYTWPSTRTIPWPWTPALGGTAAIWWAVVGARHQLGNPTGSRGTGLTCWRALPVVTEADCGRPG